MANVTEDGTKDQGGTLMHVCSSHSQYLIGVCSFAASMYTCNTCQMQLLTLILNVGCRLSQIKGHIYAQYHINAPQLDSKWSSTTLLMWLNALNAFQKVCCGVTWLNLGTHYFA